MKTSKKTMRVNNIKKLALIVLAVIIFAGLTIFLLEKLQVTSFLNEPKANSPIDNQTIINNDPPTADQKDAGELQKDESNNTTLNDDLGVSITSIDTSGDPIRIRSVISGSISNTGTCTLTLTSGSIVISKTSNTYALPNSSTCEGFDINKKEFNPGEWQLELNVKIGDKGSSITDSFSLE